MRDSPCSERGAPPARWERKQGRHCAREGSPLGPRLQLAPGARALHKPPTRTGRAEGGQGKVQPGTDWPSPTAGLRNLHTRVLSETQQDGSERETQPPGHSYLPNPKGKGPDILCTPHTGTSSCWQIRVPLSPSPKHHLQVATDLIKTSL